MYTERTLPPFAGIVSFANKSYLLTGSLTRTMGTELVTLYFLFVVLLIFWLSFMQMRTDSAALLRWRRSKYGAFSGLVFVFCSKQRCFSHNKASVYLDFLNLILDIDKT